MATFADKRYWLTRAKHGLQPSEDCQEWLGALLADRYLGVAKVADLQWLAAFKSHAINANFDRLDKREEEKTPCPALKRWAKPALSIFSARAVKRKIAFARVLVAPMPAAVVPLATEDHLRREKGQQASKLDLALASRLQAKAPAPEVTVPQALRDLTDGSKADPDSFYAGCLPAFDAKTIGLCYSEARAQPSRYTRGAARAIGPKGIGSPMPGEDDPRAIALGGSRRWSTVFAKGKLVARPGIVNGKAGLILTSARAGDAGKDSESGVPFTGTKALAYRTPAGKLGHLQGESHNDLF